MRSSMIAAFAALGLITSASAQQVDQNTRQQIERIAGEYVENLEQTRRRWHCGSLHERRCAGDGGRCAKWTARNRAGLPKCDQNVSPE